MQPENRLPVAFEEHEVRTIVTSYESFVAVARACGYEPNPLTKPIDDPNMMRLALFTHGMVYVTRIDATTFTLPHSAISARGGRA